MVTNAPKVLIVDDDRIICEDLRKILQNHGYQISGIASSERTAIELARENAPDLLLMDDCIQTRPERPWLRVAREWPPHFHFTGCRRSAGRIYRQSFDPSTLHS